MNLEKLFTRALVLFLVYVCTSSLVSGRAVLHKKSAKHRVPGQYIVVLKDGVDVNMFTSEFEASVLRGTSDGKIKQKYKYAINGFAAQLSPDSLKKLRSSAHVKYIEEDGIVHASTVNSWGLDRVDQRNLPNDGNTPSFLTNGANTHLYIIDTGTQSTHNEFSGRMGTGADFIGSSPGVDCNGHGTHCGGTAAGTSYGIATEATVHSVRVLGCDGSSTTSSTTQGVDWVIANAISPAVASMSLGGFYSQSSNDAVANMVAAGIVVSAAAGNEDVDACTTSPASAPEAITVGATDSTDTRAYFSNFGGCVDIFAPGVSINSAWIGSDTDTNSKSGTSMACPHVSGAAAALLGFESTLSPAQVAEQLQRSSTFNKVTDAKLSPNRLLYIGKNTCMTRCGDAQDNIDPCHCDSGCDSRGDCCTDYANLCGANAPSCDQRCDDASTAQYPCQCDEACLSRGDCCPDYEPICKPLEPTPCNATVTAEGHVTSPGYPSLYSNNASCSTLITASSSKVVMLEFTDVKIEPSIIGCLYDNLTIYDGSNTDGNLIDEVCGFEAPDPIISTGQSLYLDFESDDYVVYVGYTANVYFIYELQPTSCGAAITQPGSVTSPDYSTSTDYANDLSCETPITAGSGQVARLKFFVFSVEPGSSCSFDSLSVYDGDSTSASLIGKYCGNTLPDTIESSGQSLFLVFTSDVSLTYKGFHAEVDFVSELQPTPCGAAITQPGSVTSPNYSTSTDYANDLSCETPITAGSGQVARLKFIVFSVEPESSCSFDSLSVYDGDSTSASLIGKYCGNTLPDTIESSGQSMFLVFTSDVSLTYKGFHAEVDFVSASMDVLMKPTPIIPQKEDGSDLVQASMDALMKPTPIIPQMADESDRQIDSGSSRSDTSEDED